MTVAESAVFDAPVRRRHAPKHAYGLVTAWVFLGIILFAALAAPLVSPYSPTRQDLSVGGQLQGPSLTHLLGTDADGQDVLSRLIWGARPALEGLVIGLLVMLVIGIPWGLAAGYLGRWVDEALMRTADALLAFPGIVLAVAITGVLGPTLINAMTAVGVVLSPSIARLLRGSVQPLRTADYVRIPALFGVGRLRIAMRHVLPNAMAPVLVQTCAIASIMLIIEAALSFLGVSGGLTAPAWGAQLSAAYSYFVSAPLASVAPGLVITLTALSLSRAGDGLRARLGVG
jgi:peptide/nickel transport system permease protein